MHVIYRFFVFVLGLIGAGEALGINIFFSASRRFQDLVGLHPAVSHGWIGLVIVMLAFLGAVLALPQRLIPYGGALLVITGVAFFSL